MQIVTEIQKIQNLCQSWKDKGETISFVPTMGCLHSGHLSLVKKARSVAEHVVVSIFVNPIQFGDNSDFSNYPSTLEEDGEKLRELKVDLLFAPDASSFYPEGENKVERVELGSIATILEGAHRPGHFAGVATVVKRLFELIRPNSAVFGEKDFQQLLVIKQLVSAFSMNIEIIGMPTFREDDGLAMSSRNLRLNQSEREKAAEIFRQLNLIKSALNVGEKDFLMLEKMAIDSLSSVGFIPDYVVIRNVSDLDNSIKPNNLKVILAAATLGKVRLIDNLRV